jgi:UDPglucose 6-dehydrogenase
VIVEFLGDTSLALTLATAARRRGFEIDNPRFAEVVFVAVEVSDHTDLSGVEACLRTAIGSYHERVPIVVTSQVPPGWTRLWATKRANIFYQPHTLIAGREAEMAYAPASIVVGSDDPAKPLPVAYADYLEAFGAPIHRMSYESAELSKLAVNYLLASQINTANVLSDIARIVGADWDAIERVLRADGRIGPDAYIRPGTPGGHLPRDITTIERLRSVQ